MSPKEVVSKVTGSTTEKKDEITSLKSKATINGAFFGGLFGFLYAHYNKKNVIMSSLVGVVSGGLISNFLTVKE